MVWEVVWSAKSVKQLGKIDKKNADIDQTISNISDLFLELATHENQLDFPTGIA